MRISVFGLGYVGCVTAACLADAGHDVVGVDVNNLKVDFINNGESPLIEPSLTNLLRKVVLEKKLCATNDFRKAVLETELSIICVGTPSQSNGSINLDVVRLVANQIGRVLKTKSDFHTVVVRSTVLPGTTEKEFIPIIEQCSGKTHGKGFGVCFNPEFLREGSAINDFINPPIIILGSECDYAFQSIEEMYSFLPIPIIKVSTRVSEMVKYASNIFHAMKISFANEIGMICNRNGIDSYSVMDLLCQDTVLNISTKYLKPGFAFGGSCLPKDLCAIIHRCRQDDMDIPLINSILQSNEHQIERCVKMILDTGLKNVAVLGLSFKSGTDDLRESSTVKLVKRLIGEGLEVSIYDRNVSIAKLLGSNRIYIEEKIPHISSLIKEDLRKIVEENRLILITYADHEFSLIKSYVNHRHKIMDIVGLFYGDTDIEKNIIPFN